MSLIEEEHRRGDVARRSSRVTISMAITSVHSVIAVWMPVMVVPTSSATVASATFIAELSSGHAELPRRPV